MYMEVEKCKFCEKEVSGYSRKHTKYMLMQHIFAKHPEKVKIEGENE